MSSLDNLTAKIVGDFEAKAREITGAARAEADARIARETAGAKAESEKLIADARIEAAHTAEQIVQGKTLSIRDENLGAKRQMLDRVFAEALARLNGMPGDEFWNYLCEYLGRLSLDGEEIVLPAHYGITSIDELNAALKKAGKKGNLTLNTDPDRMIDGGFVLIKKGIEQNHTFASLLDYYRDELESEVLKILYA